MFIHFLWRSSQRPGGGDTVTQPSSWWREANRFKRLQIACHVLQVNTVFFACLPYFSPLQLPHLLCWSPAGTSVTSWRSFSSKALHSFLRNARCSRHLIETLTLWHTSRRTCISRKASSHACKIQCEDDRVSCDIVFEDCRHGWSWKRSGEGVQDEQQRADAGARPWHRCKIVGQWQC